MKNSMRYLTTRFNKTLKTVGGRNIALLTLFLFIVLISVVFNDSWLIATNQESKELAHLNQSALEISQLKINLLKAESSQRGFLLTNSKNYLTPYDEAVGDAKRNIDKINEIFLAIDNNNEYENEKK